MWRRGVQCSQEVRVVEKNERRYSVRPSRHSSSPFFVIAWERTDGFASIRHDPCNISPLFVVVAGAVGTGPCRLARHLRQRTSADASSGAERLRLSHPLRLSGQPNTEITRGETVPEGGVGSGACSEPHRVRDQGIDYHLDLMTRSTNDFRSRQFDLSITWSTTDTTSPSLQLLITPDWPIFRATNRSIDQ